MFGLFGNQAIEYGRLEVALDDGKRQARIGQDRQLLGEIFRHR